MDSKSILPVWQPVGYSTNLISQKVSEKFNIKTSHTGTIDPMAEGIIVVLLGDERLKKYEYANWAKGYEFQIIFGISTDTYDGMGMIKNINFENKIKRRDLENLHKKFLGKYSQKIPIYSAKKIKGKCLHEYAREKLNITVPTKDGDIYSFKFLKLSKINTQTFVKKITKNIKKINGDFRQKEIIMQWNLFLRKNTKQKLYTAKFYAKTSKGIYIRSLSQDICRSLDTIGFVYSLKRVSNGVYTKINSHKLGSVVNC